MKTLGPSLVVASFFDYIYLMSVRGGPPTPQNPDLATVAIIVVYHVRVMKGK